MAAGDKIDFSDMQKSRFKSLMKKFGMRQVKFVDKSYTWCINDSNELQSCYLYEIKPYKSNISYSRETKKEVVLIKNLIIHKIKFYSVGKSVTSYFCQWLEQLMKCLNCHSRYFFEQKMDSIKELEVWLNEAALVYREKILSSRKSG